MRQHERLTRERENLAELIREEIEKIHSDFPEYFETADLDLSEVFSLVMEGLRHSDNAQNEDMAYELFESLIEDWL